jgi:hypothetical protein
MPREKNNKKRKKAIVYLPAVIQKPGQEDEMCEMEIEYKDKLLCADMEKLAAKGLSNNEIIQKLGISRDTFYSKLRSNPYFSYCLYKHRGIAQVEVESALFKSALGFEYKEEQATNKGVFEVRKVALPNVSAQKEWLYNRASHEWKKKIETTITLASDITQLAFAVKRRE